MVIKVLRKSLPGRRRNKGDEPTVEQDDIDDAATALELALHESTPPHSSRSDVGASTLASTLALARPRSLSPLENAQPATTSVMVSTLERVSPNAKTVLEQHREARDDDNHATASVPNDEKPMTKSPKLEGSAKASKTRSQSKAKDDKQKSRAGVKSKKASKPSKSKKEEPSKPWVRTFQRGTADSGDATLPPLQITITAALLTGLVATPEKSKRSASQKEKTKGRTTDLVAGYVRLIPSKTVSLVPFSPKLVKSLPLSPMVQNNTSAKDRQTFVIWANDHPHGSGTLLLDTKGLSREPAITLEIGVVSNEQTLALGTATFQPGTMEINDRRRHLKVEKLRHLQGSGLFRKKHQLGDTMHGSEYRLSRESFLTLKVDVKQGPRTTAPIPATYEEEATSRRRPITPAGLEMTFSSASLASEARQLTTRGQQPDCGVSAAVLGFFALVCCWCCSDNTTSDDDKKSPDETTDDESTDAESCSTKNVQNNQGVCCGNNVAAQREHVDTDADITLNDPTLNDVTLNDATLNDATLNDATLNQLAEKMEAPGSDGKEESVDDQSTFKKAEDLTARSGSAVPTESPPQNEKAIDIIKEVGDDEGENKVESCNPPTKERDNGSGGPAYMSNVCGACFGDTDVEELQALQRRAREKSCEANGSVHGDAFSSAKSFAETVSTQVARRSLCAAWCGEEDVERILPVEQRPRALAQTNVQNTSHVTSGGNFDSAVSNEKSQSESLCSESTDEKSTIAPSQSRSLGDILKGDKDGSGYSTGYASYSTDYTSTIQEDTPGNGCFPFMSGLDAAAESASTSYDSSASGDSLTVFSRPSHQQSQEQDNRKSSQPDGDGFARASDVSLVDADENSESLDGSADNAQ